MKIQHIRSTDIWLMSKGPKVLYRGKQSPWQSPKVIATALERDGLKRDGLKRDAMKIAC